MLGSRASALGWEPIIQPRGSRLGVGPAVFVPRSSVEVGGGGEPMITPTGVLTPSPLAWEPSARLS